MLHMMTSTIVYQKCCPSKCMVFHWWDLIYVALVVSKMFVSTTCVDVVLFSTYVCGQKTIIYDLSL